jgi:hypothetical protein
VSGQGYVCARRLDREEVGRGEDRIEQGRPRHTVSC